MLNVNSTLVFNIPLFLMTVPFVFVTCICLFSYIKKINENNTFSISCVRSSFLDYLHQKRFKAEYLKAKDLIVQKTFIRMKCLTRDVKQAVIDPQMRFYC